MGSNAKEIESSNVDVINVKLIIAIIYLEIDY